MEAILMHTDLLTDEVLLCGVRLWAVTNKKVHFPLLRYILTLELGI